MARLAGRLARGRCSARPGPALPALWLVTDPDRTPDPLGLAATLPRGAGVIHRTFGRPEAVAAARPLAALARSLGLVLLIGADARLAAEVGAAGVHLPERAIGQGRRLKAAHPRWIVTAAAHSPRALALAFASGADAALLSPAFQSASPSAGPPLGAVRFAGLVRGARLPVHALGGVDGSTARRLVGTGAAGFAAVDAFRT